LAGAAGGGTGGGSPEARLYLRLHQFNGLRARSASLDRRPRARQRNIRSERCAVAKPAHRSQATRADESRVRTLWRILLAAAALVAVAALGFVAWNVSGPGPTDFAGRDRIALSDTKLGDPTGAPASLKDANLVERGRRCRPSATSIRTPRSPPPPQLCHGALRGRGLAPDGGERRLAPAHRVTDHLLHDLFMAAIRPCD
jgi:hypothetical protein